MERDDQAIVVLIDGDNVSHQFAASLFAEISKYGRVVVRRVYGDWSKPHLKGWMTSLQEHSVVPVQQTRYTTGKNATDGRMIIDAMDLLYRDKYDAFCLVSSDSDFTSLASRIREAGLTVYGFGEQKTPKSFVTACDRFLYFESVSDEAEKRKPFGRDELHADRTLLKTLKKGVEELSDDSGWVHLAPLAQYLKKNITDFDTRNYGHAKLARLLESMDEFEFDHRGPTNNPGSVIFLKFKD